jgi:hypothetical protein
MTNEGRETNDDWDGVWSVKTRIVSDGWIAEIAVPFRTLKFREQDVQTRKHPRLKSFATSLA